MLILLYFLIFRLHLFFLLPVLFKSRWNTIAIGTSNWGVFNERDSVLYCAADAPCHSAGNAAAVADRTY